MSDINLGSLSQLAGSPGADPMVRAGLATGGVPKPHVGADGKPRGWGDMERTGATQQSSCHESSGPRASATDRVRARVSRFLFRSPTPLASELLARKFTYSDTLHPRNSP